MEFTVSAIIVNYNAGELLRDSVESLLNSPLSIEVIVVDNASSDRSLEFIEDLGPIKIIKNTYNMGFAAACNIGITNATTSYLFFLNPDCTFTRGTLIELLNHLKSNKNIGMVGGLLVNPDGTEQAGGRRAVPTPWRSFVRAFGLNCFAQRWPKLFFDFDLHKHPLPQKPIEVEAISGACMLVKREAINDVGLWDEGYFLHCEDLDWCMRFRKHGWKILFIPSAKVVHALGACGKSRPIFVEWHKHKGMMRFYQKFFRHQYPGLFMWLVNVGVWFRFTMIVLKHYLKRSVDHLRLNHG